MLNICIKKESTKLLLEKKNLITLNVSISLELSLKTNTTEISKVHLRD